MTDRASLRELLREATAPLHARVEARVPVLDPTLDRAGYERVLGVMLRVYRPLERRLVALPIVGLAAERDRKTAWLERDLAALGAPEGAIAAVPDSRHVPALGSLADALGCRYVLEGATLGGAIIARHVVERLGLEGGGASFFSAYRGDTGARWREFVAVLDGWGVEHPSEHAAVVRAAQATFLALERELHHLSR